MDSAHALSAIISAIISAIMLPAETIPYGGFFTLYSILRTTIPISIYQWLSMYQWLKPDSVASVAFQRTSSSIINYTVLSQEGELDPGMSWVPSVLVLVRGLYKMKGQW